MRRLTKIHSLTWWNGSDNYKPGGSFDHVIAANHLVFRNLHGSDVSLGAHWVVGRVRPRP